ncbi:MAG: hypothetical protein PVI35_02055 [Acidimicrobiia bacterium]
MGEVISRFLQAARLQRDPFIWMDFNDRATGDALLLVVVTRFLWFLGAIGFGRFSDLVNFRVWDTLVRWIISGLFFWLLFAAITWAVIRFLLEAGGDFATLLRITGFAYPTLLVALFFDTIVGSSDLAFVLGAGWMLAIVARGVQYVSDLAFGRAVVAAVAGLAGSIVVIRVLSGLPL